MTDAAGSASPDQGNAGIPNADKGGDGADKGSGNGASSDIFAGLDTGIREYVGNAGFKFEEPAKLVAGLVEKTRNAESLIGRSVQLPDAKTAKPEDWDKFYGKVGRPEKPDGYEFKLPDGVPKEMPYDADFAKEFKPAAHKIGLRPEQAAAVHDFYVGKAAQFFKSQGEALTKRVNTATEGLQKAWGPPEGEKFKDSSDMTVRALKGLGIEKAFQDTGLLGPNNMVLDAGIALALEKVGRAMFKEDAMVTGVPGGSSGDNPFKDGPNKGNLTQQMQTVAADKANAIRLIRAAGHDPKAWNLTE